jgi:hypothetical protein
LENIYFSSTLLWHKPVEQVVCKAVCDQLPGAEFWAPNMLNHDSDPLITPIIKPAAIQFTMHAPSCWNLNIILINCSVGQSKETVTQPCTNIYTSFNVALITKLFDAPFCNHKGCVRIHISDNVAAPMQLPLRTAFIPERIDHHFPRQNQKIVVEALETNSISWVQNVSFGHQHLQIKERVI